jgi:uncharacterized protein YggU (UPF0235/DUF167 family)
MKYIHVKVTAGAGKESLSLRPGRGGQASADHFLCSVREPAEQNRANARVLELLAGHFGVPKNKVRIINGHKSPSKLVVIEG